MVKASLQNPSVAYFHHQVTQAERTGLADTTGLNLQLPVQAELNLRVQELCESRGGRPGPPKPNSPCGLCGRKATLNLNLESRSCVKAEVAVLGSPSLILIVLMVSVDVKQHRT